MTETKKKKLLILAGPLDNQSAGIHVYTRELIHNLHLQDDLPFEVILIRNKKADDYPKFKSIILPIPRYIPGIEAVHIFFTIPVVSILQGADIVLEPAHFGPFNLPHWIRRVTVIHDLTPVLFPQWHKFQGWFLQKLFLKKICQRADLILTVSDHTKSDIVTHFKISADKIIRIYPGISEAFRPTTDKNLMQKYGLIKPYFLTVGTIEPRKNHSLILKAFQAYKRKTNAPDQLVIAGGTGWKVKHLIEDMESHSYRKDIILTGYVPETDLAGLYTQCKAFIYASHYEGFGLPVVEAAACGATCYVANNSSLTELSNPLISYFNSEEELSSLFGQDIEEKNLSKRKEVTLLIKKKFSWSNFISKFTNTINSIS